MIVIIKKDGSRTTPPMAQAQANNYLKKLLNAESHACLSQCLNQMCDHNGKATGFYSFDERPVLHASAGKIGANSGVVIFFYTAGGTHYIFAMGQHIDSKSYAVNIYGQPDGDFKEGKAVRLN